MPARTRLARLVRRPKNGARGRARGQSLAEFALVAPIMILLLLVALDFGRLFMSYITLNNTVRVAANYASLYPDQFTGTPNTTDYDALVGRETVSLGCDLQADGGGNQPPLPTYPTGTGLGSPAVATMQCDFRLLTPFISAFFGGGSGTLPMTAEARFPVRTGAIANIGGTTTVPVPGSPVAAFTFDGVSNGTVNGAGNVTGTDPVSLNVIDGSSNAQTWLWDFGDGTTDDTSAPPTHTFTGASTFTVTLTVTNPAGASSISRTVTLVSPTSTPALADFYGTPQGSPPFVDGGGASGAAIQAIRGTRVDFSNQSTNAIAFSWDFGDGSAPSTADDPSHSYPNLGIYTVVLSVTDPTGASPKTRTDYVTIGCVGPNFANTMTNTAASQYSGAGFTGTVWYRASGSKNASKSAPSVAKLILSQEGLQGGQFYLPTKQGNQPYACENDVTVVYQP